jgi:hypothetical protein
MTIAIVAFVSGYVCFQIGRIMTESHFNVCVGKRTQTLLEPVYIRPEPKLLVHIDQDCTGELPSMRMSITGECQMIHQSVRARTI